MSSLFQRRSPVNEDGVVLLVLRVTSVCKHGSQLSPSKVGLGPAPYTVLMPGHISALPNRQWQCLGQRLAQHSNGAASDHALTADDEGISCDGTTQLNSSVYSVGARDNRKHALKRAKLQTGADKLGTAAGKYGAASCNRATNGLCSLSCSHAHLAAAARVAGCGMVQVFG